MDESGLPADTLPLTPGTSTTTSTPEAGRALAVASRLARSQPLSDDLRGLLEGKLGAAMSAAADYAGDASHPPRGPPTY